MAKKSNDEYVVLDIETTGLSKYMHKITEIAAVKIKGKKIIGEYQSLINPETHIPSFITRLTGINDELVKDAPKIHEELPNFLEFLSDKPIIAHNASFDYGFLSHNVDTHLKTNFLNEKICTRKLANRLLPELPSKKLSILCELFEITNEQAHRAMADTKATAELFLKMRNMMQKSNIKTLEEVKVFETKPRQRNY